MLMFDVVDRERKVITDWKIAVAEGECAKQRFVICETHQPTKISKGLLWFRVIAVESQFVELGLFTVVNVD